MTAGIHRPAGLANREVAADRARRVEVQRPAVEHRIDTSAQHVVRRERTTRADVRCDDRAAPAAAIGTDRRGDVGAEYVLVLEGDLVADVQKVAEIEAEADGVVAVTDVDAGQIGGRVRGPAGDRRVVRQRLLGEEADHVLGRQRFRIDDVLGVNSRGADEIVGLAGVAGGGLRVRVGKARECQAGKACQRLDRGDDVELLTVGVEVVVMRDREEPGGGPNPHGALVKRRPVRIGDPVEGCQFAGDPDSRAMVVVRLRERRTAGAGKRETLKGPTRGKVVICWVEDALPRAVVQDARAVVAALPQRAVVVDPDLDVVAAKDQVVQRGRRRPHRRTQRGPGHRQQRQA